MPREAADRSNISTNKISKTLDKVTDAASQQLEETMSMIWGALKTGASPQDIFDIKPETIEYFYSQAYRMYNQGKYKEALYLFQMLLMMDPMQPRHSLGSAACLHRMGKYEAAGKVYLLAAPLDPENPLPYFHAADCYIKLHAQEIAEFHLKECLERCANKPSFALIKERALLMLEACRVEIARPDRGKELGLEEKKENS